jgi:mono/diheme cytochrome c family protein
MKKNLVFVVVLCSMGVTSFAQKKSAFDSKASMARGTVVYQNQCITCHMEAGDGVEGVYPPLAKSDYLMADKTRSIQQILHGINATIKVNGVSYEAEMPAVELTDEELSDVLNYIRNSWGNKGDAVRPEDVKAQRK